MMVLKFYKFFTIISSPLMKFYILLRVLFGKEDKLRYKEKFVITELKRPEGQIIWLHAVSLGEFNLLAHVVRSLNSKFPNLIFLITTTTINAANAFKTAKLNNSIHQFFPLDIPSCITSFLKHWRPDLIIFFESEIWPNIISEVNKKIPFILANARLSDQSFYRWKMFHTIASDLFAKFSIVLASTKTDYFKFKHFMNTNLHYVGNIKNACPPLGYSKALYDKLQKQLEGKLVWVAASTHFGEEGIIISIHDRLKKFYSNLVTIIVPRHPVRGKEIKAIADKFNFKTSLYSDEISTTDWEIYIADCIGELGSFYRLTSIAFIGGSLIKQGGHNILEAAKLRCAIIVGPYTYNFKDIVEEFLDNEAILIVNDENTFLEKLKELFDNPEKTNAFSEAAFHISSNNSTNAIDETVKYISDLLPNSKV